MPSEATMPTSVLEARASEEFTTSELSQAVDIAIIAIPKTMFFIRCSLNLLSIICVFY